MRKRDLLAAAVVAAAGALAVTGSAAAATRPALLSVSIQGSAVVGQTLSAAFQVAGDPVTKIEYQWRRCKADKPDDCGDIKDAKAATYTVTPTDLGFRLRVRVKVRNSAGDDEDQSFPSAIVSTAPQPSPAAPPPAAFASSPSPADIAPGGPRLLRPFPVVRVAGYIRSHGSRIVVFSVKAPRGVKVDVRCTGRRCPLRHRTFRPGRIKPLERYLPAGTAITIRVMRPGFIGTYTRVVIRSRKRPRRRDACLLPGDSRARPCQGLRSSPT
jgi:hypothetical protein